MRLRKKYLALVSGFSLSVLITGAILIASQQQGISNSPPTQTAVPTIAWQNTRLPDWNQIIFAKMPAISESGTFEAPNQVIDKLGYDPSRNWSAGQSPDSFTMLGDFQDSFQLQKFSLTDIAPIASLDLNKLNLESFGVIKLQTLGSLVNAIPDLKQYTIASVKPIADLLSQDLSTSEDSN